ncbi:MAG: DUF721 domain-containing protein [Synergistaceae bacterium]|nr:DUF721 domain-containing protein [Synergistaceae bacterium]
MESLKDAGRLFTTDVPDAVKACLKLAELEQEWHNVAGEAIAERSSPSACEFVEEGLRITINVTDAGVAQAVKFRRSALIKSLRKFLSLPSIQIDVKVGKITRRSAAKPPLPACRRRAPVIISEKAVKEETKRLTSENGDPEIAETVARLKVASEKLSLRKNG